MACLARPQLILHFSSRQNLKTGPQKLLSFIVKFRPAPPWVPAERWEGKPVVKWAQICRVSRHARVVFFSIPRCEFANRFITKELKVNTRLSREVVSGNSDLISSCCSADRSPLQFCRMQRHGPLGLRWIIDTFPSPDSKLRSQTKLVSTRKKQEMLKSVMIRKLLQMWIDSTL